MAFPPRRPVNINARNINVRNNYNFPQPPQQPPNPPQGPREHTVLPAIAGVCTAAVGAYVGYLFGEGVSATFRSYYTNFAPYVGAIGFAAGFGITTYINTYNRLNHR